MPPPREQTPVTPAPTTRAVATTLGAGAVAVSAATTTAVGVVTLLAAVTVFAAGWPRLVGLPTLRGATAVVAAAGAAAVVTALLGPPGGLVVVMGLAVVAAFVHEMSRRDGRPRLVESLSGVVTGATVVVAGSLWLVVDRDAAHDPLAMVGAAALAVAVLTTALPLPDLLAGAVATVLAAGVGVLGGWQLPEVGLYPGAVVGAGTGVMTAALHLVFGRSPGAGRPTAALAAAMTPLLVGAVPVYLATGLPTG